MSYLGDVATLARKDLRLELRARDTLPAMALFVLSTLVVFHFALPTGADEVAAQGLLWVALVFTALLGLARAWAPEREPLRHPARVRGEALAAHLPEAVALEQHPDPLAALAYAVETAEELEVLERGEVAVEERLVAEVPEPAPVGVDVEPAGRRGGEPGEQPEQRRLARAVRAGDDEKAARIHVEVERLEGAASPVALLDAASPDHRSTSASTKQRKTMLITPLTVKNAAFSRRRSPGLTSECS